MAQGGAERIHHRLQRFLVDTYSISVPTSNYTVLQHHHRAFTGTGVRVNVSRELLFQRIRLSPRINAQLPRHHETERRVRLP